MSTAEEFRRRFGLELERRFNDYSYDLIQDSSLHYGLSIVRETDPKKFGSIRKFAARHAGSRDESALLLRAHLLYMEKKYDKALKCFMELASRNPLDVNRWIDLAFGLLHAKKHYDLGLDLLFNLYGYIHCCLRLNVQTLNIQNLLLIQKAMQGPGEYANKYILPVKFGDEFLILSRECNNNCISCPNETRERLVLDCSIREYLQKKIGKPWIKKLVFTGGEPTILPDFFGVLRDVFAVRPGIRLAVQTNGRAFSDPEFVNCLREFKDRDIVFEVGLFSHKPNVHDRISRCRGSFGQTKRGIENLLANAYNTELNLLLCGLNDGGLRKTLDYINSAYPSLRKINLVLPVPSGNCQKSFGRYLNSNMEKAADLLRNYSGKIRIKLRNAG